MALDEFRERIAQAGLQLPPALLVNGDVDATLLRFLRARKYNVENAFAMLQSECTLGAGALVSAWDAAPWFACASRGAVQCSMSQAAVDVVLTAAAVSTALRPAGQMIPCKQLMWA